MVVAAICLTMCSLCHSVHLRSFKLGIVGSCRCAPYQTHQVSESRSCVKVIAVIFMRYLYHAISSKICFKYTYEFIQMQIQRQTLDVAIYDAAMVYNAGETDILPICTILGVCP